MQNIAFARFRGETGASFAKVDHLIFEVGEGGGVEDPFCATFFCLTG